MAIKPKPKSILIFAGVLIAVVLIYVFVFPPSRSEDTTLVPVANLPTSQAGTPVSSLTPLADEISSDSVNREFLNLLLSIRSIHLDAEGVFSDPVFGSLMDFTIVLVQDNTEGRSNPFAPIGSEFQTPPSTPAPQNSSDDESFTL